MKLFAERRNVTGKQEWLLNYGDHDHARVFLALTPEEKHLNAGRFTRFRHEIQHHEISVPFDILRIAEMVQWANEQNCIWSMRLFDWKNNVRYDNESDIIYFSFEQLTPAVVFRLTFSA